ncbi:MAG: hypothetical protein HYT09_04005 [Candidatus Levybacteria bacterium]|nr:hypothetical protein [Candidatus Levybacteria bacterium]
MANPELGMPALPQPEVLSGELPGAQELTTPFPALPEIQPETQTEPVVRKTRRGGGVRSALGRGALVLATITGGATVADAQPAFGAGFMKTGGSDARCENPGTIALNPPLLAVGEPFNAALQPGDTVVVETAAGVDPTLPPTTEDKFTADEVCIVDLIQENVDDWVNNTYKQPPVGEWFTRWGKFAPLGIISEVDPNKEIDKDISYFFQGVNLGSEIITDGNGDQRLKGYIGFRPKIGDPYFIEVNFGKLSNRPLLNFYDIGDRDYPFDLNNYRSSTEKLFKILQKNEGRVLAYDFYFGNVPKITDSEWQERVDELRPQTELARDFVQFSADLDNADSDMSKVDIPESVKGILNRRSDVFVPELTLTPMGVYYYTINR